MDISIRNPIGAGKVSDLHAVCAAGVLMLSPGRRSLSNPVLGSRQGDKQKCRHYQRAWDTGQHALRLTRDLEYSIVPRSLETSGAVGMGTL